MICNDTPDNKPEKTTHVRATSALVLSLNDLRGTSAKIPYCSDYRLYDGISTASSVSPKLYKYKVNPSFLRSYYYKQIRTFSSQRSRRLEVVSERKNGRARETREGLARPFFLLPTTSKRLRRRLDVFKRRTPGHSLMRVLGYVHTISGSFSFVPIRKATQLSMNTYPICDSTLRRSAPRFTPLPKSRRNHRSGV